MELSIDEILRRLLLLGLPLVPLGCDPAHPLRGMPDAHMSLFDASGSGGAGGAAGWGLDGMAGSSVGGGAGGGIVGGAGGAAGGGLGGMGGSSFGGGAGGGVGGYFGTSCPAGPGGIPFESTVMITRSQATDSGAFEMCLYQNACGPLCSSVALRPAGGFISSCERLDARDAGAAGAADPLPPPDGAADARADGAEASVTLHIAGSHFNCTGRRPAGMAHLCPPTRGTASGRWLAGAAALEAASIPAFRQLVRELEAHAAPARLVQAARAAVAEEARHYRLTASAARARGATAKRVRVPRVPIRGLLELARDNAREGCVRETFGAFTAVHQARHAPAGDVRALMQLIARDETAHARLAWEIDAWARARLPRHEALLVDDARRAEAAALVGQVRRERVPAAVARELGLPSARESLRLARAAHRAVWSA